MSEDPIFYRKAGEKCSVSHCSLCLLCAGEDKHDSYDDKESRRLGLGLGLGLGPRFYHWNYTQKYK